MSLFYHTYPYSSSNAKELKPRECKWLGGVYQESFEQMVALLMPPLDHKGKRGRQIKLSVLDELLIALQYWREEHTYFHIAQS